MPPRKLKMTPQGKGGMMDYVKRVSPPQSLKNVIEHITPTLKTVRKEVLKPSPPASVVGDIPTPRLSTESRAESTTKINKEAQTTASVAGDNASLYKGLKQLLNPTERRKAELEEQLSGEGAKRLAPVERERLAFTLQQSKENEALAEYGRRYEVKGEERVNKDPRFWKFQTQVKPMPPDPTTTGDYKKMREKVLMLSLFPNMWNQC